MEKPKNIEKGEIMLTYKRLCEVLDYNPKTGIFRWKESRGRVKAGDIAGCKCEDGYIRIRIDSKIYLAHRIAWFYVHGYFPENLIDHKNRNEYDNWIDNLRETSSQCNLRNSGNYKRNKSGVKGVSWYKVTKKWQVQICINQKDKHLGYFDDFDEAVIARYEKEKEIGWSGCDSSSPAYRYLKRNRPDYFAG